MMNRHLRNKRIVVMLVMLITMLFSVQTVLAASVQADASGVAFRTIEGNLAWDNGVSVNKGEAVFELEKTEGKRPRSLEWSWQGSGQVWASVEFSDKNIIYYVLKGTGAPEAPSKSYIDSKGVPRIIVPVMVEIPDGAVSLDLLRDYYRYYGKKEIGVESVRFGLKAAGYTELKDFKVVGYKQKQEGTGIEEEVAFKDISLQIQIPQGNKDVFYLVRDVEFPVQVEVSTLLDKSESGNITIAFPDTVRITAYDKTKLKLDEKNVLSMPLAMGAGYAAESFAISVIASGPGRVAARVQLGEKTEKLEKDIACTDLESITNNLALLDEGVSPMEHTAHKVTLKKELKNYIKVKEDILSTLHKLFGAREQYDQPTGLVCGVLKNNTGYSLPLHVKYMVVDEKGKEITYFRGEHFQKEESAEPQVPETVLSVDAGSMREFRMPLYADIYSVKPGVYKSMLKVSFFGNGTEIIVREFDLHVEKESQLQIIIGLTAVILSILSVLLMVLKQKTWIMRLKTSEIIFIALFTAVKFSIVDIPWFVFGDVIKALLGPLGPFIIVVTGIFWDIFNAMLLVVLIVLVPKSGVVIISSVVRLILQGIAFGTFNPITILLMLSYAFLVDAMFYLIGFTRGARQFKECLSTFVILGVVFVVYHVYSTYTYYYIWMYLYRLYYPDWYININAIVSVVYSVLGCAMGVYLGNKLKRVVE